MLKNAPWGKRFASNCETDWCPWNPGGIFSGPKLAVTEQKGKASGKGNFQRKYFSWRSFQSAAVSEGVRMEMQVTVPPTHAVYKECVCMCVCARACVRREGPRFFKMSHRQSEKHGPNLFSVPGHSIAWAGSTASSERLLSCLLLLPKSAALGIGIYSGAQRNIVYFIKVNHLN